MVNAQHTVNWFIPKCHTYIPLKAPLTKQKPSAAAILSTVASV